MTSFTKGHGSNVARRFARLGAALAFAGVFTAACDDGTGPQRLETLTVTPASATLAAGGTQQFTVTGVDTEGNTVRIDGESWAVVAGGGTINATTGLFTAGTTAGTFTNTIRVTCNGVTAFATIIVTPGPAATIVVAPDTTLAIGATAQFRAVIRDANGNILTATPVWSATNPPGTIAAATGMFTAGNAVGSFPNSVQACIATTTICDQANVTVIAGPAASIVVAPDTTLVTGATAQFRAVVRDAGGNILTVTPVWSTTNPPGTIVAATGFFTASNTVGSFPNSVQACIATTTICDQANVTVISPPPPPPPASGGFTVLGRAAVSCTLGTITPGDVGTFQAAGDAPPGSITPSCIPVTTGTVHAPGDAATKTAYNNFLAAYIARAPQPGDCDATHTLTGSLAGVTLAPGVYCFSAGATLTGTLTLDGPSTGTWLFKTGTTGTGGLTGTSFTVIMAGAAQACNVTWWVRDAATMTDSNLKGTVMAGTGVTVTNGTFNGNMWAGASGTGDATESNAAITGCP
jgi:hypothetical protein